MRAIALLSATLCLFAGGARAEHWIASSNTATSITGNVLFVPGEIRFANGASLKLAPAEALHGFGVGGSLGGSTVEAQLYRVLNPADPALLRGNRLCGGGAQQRPVQTIVVWQPRPIPGVEGSNRAMAAYSGLAKPGSDHDPGLCGTYSYDAHP